MNADFQEANWVWTLAYTLAFDYKDRQVRILCVPGVGADGPRWSFYEWTDFGGHSFSQLSYVPDQKMVMRKSDAEIEVEERSAIRAEEQRRAMLTGGGY